MIAAGIGCTSHCPAADIEAVVRLAEAKSGVSATVLAIPHFKSSHVACLQAAHLLALKIVLVEASELLRLQPDCPTRSEAARRNTGLASVAEAAALAAAGRGARLILPRLIHGFATCALAEAA